VLPSLLLFAHLYACSTKIAKIDHFRYQFPCNHLRCKVRNLIRCKSARKGNFYLPVGKLPPDPGTD
jgi:hypothetical protein